MRNEKSLYPRFAPRERKRMIRFLENQAQKGWLFCGFGGLGWKFCRTEPRKLRYAITYFTAQSEDDLEEQRKMDDFREYCAHSGWEFAGKSGCMQIFYTEREDAVPIETDPRSEVESVYLAQGAGYGNAFLVLFGICIFSLVYLWHTNESSVILFLTDQQCTWLFLAALVITIMYGLFVLECKFWHKRAKRHAEVWGEFLDESSIMAALRWIGYIGLFLIFAVVIFSAGWKVFFWKMAAWGLMIAAMTLAWAWIGSRNYDKSKRRNRLFLAYFLIYLFTAFISDLTSEKLNVGFDLNAPEASAWTQYMEIPPLTSDETDDYTITLQETGFLASYQVAAGDAFQYTVVDVKLDFLYGCCLNEMLPQETLPVDAAPWGADMAYQTYIPKSDIPYRYILCYEDRIVELKLSWEPDPEQMAVVREKLAQ